MMMDQLQLPIVPPAEGNRSSQRLRRRQQAYREFIPAKLDNLANLGDYSIDLGSLCPKCCEVRSWIESNEDDVKTIRPKIWLRHHHSGLELEHSVDRGCHLCTIVWYSLLLEIERLSPHFTRQLPVETKRKRRQMKIRQGNEVSIAFIKSREHYFQERASNRKMMVARIKLDRVHFNSSEILVGPHIPEWHTLQPSRSPTCTASDLSMELATTWLNRCT
jgi:hypothetical protein